MVASPLPAAAPTAASEARRVQRHTVRVLVLTQALGGIGVTTGVTVAALLARDLSGSESLAGMAQTGQVLGAAVGAAGIAAVTTRLGRRPALVTGYLIGAFGAALCVVAGVAKAFPLLLVGAVLLGSATAANNQSRYAATDLAEPWHRASALATVVWATTVGAVLGPNLTGPGERLAARLGIPGLTGPFLIGMACLLAAGLTMAVRLRPDPLLLARAVHREHLDANPARAVSGTGHDPGLVAILRGRPGLVAAIVGLALSQAVMVAVMIMTPLHMSHGHAELHVIGLVISVHVLGMYALSPIMGLIADRWGRPALLTGGGLVLLLALALAGGSPAGWSWGLSAGLLLLGVGWSAASVAASTMVTEQAPREFRPHVQGAADVITGVTAAIGGAVAGVVVDKLGYGWLNAVSAVFVVGILAAARVGAHLARGEAR